MMRFSRCLAAVAVLLWAGVASGQAVEYPAPAGTSLAGEPSRAEMVDGRLENQQALAIREGTLGWEVRDFGPNYYVEFWLKPVRWNALDGSAVALAEMGIGTDRYTLRKVAGRTDLVLEKNGEVVQTYPVYSWDDGKWATGMPRKRIFQRAVGWHHVNLTVAGADLLLTVNGFPARRVTPANVSGRLNALRLNGNPGTAFSDLVIASGGSLDPANARKRFITLLMSAPTVEMNLVTVPFMRSPPVVDGRLNREEWEGATRLGGWVTTEEGRLAGNETAAYLGYDREHLYLGVIVSGAGGREAVEEGDTLDIFLAPPFVSGERPRRLIQLTGARDGTQKGVQLLPSADENWNGRWTWKTGGTSEQWVGEFSARFRDLGLPLPEGDDTWTANFIHSRSGIAWTHPAGAMTDVESTGEVRFSENVPVIRLGEFVWRDDSVVAMVEIFSPDRPRRVTVGADLFGEGELQPSESVEMPRGVMAGRSLKLELPLPLNHHRSGRIAVHVKSGDERIYYHSIRFSAAGESEAD